MADWTEKYRPSTLAEVRGNDKARDALREWADTWDQHREAVIVHGSPGIGKTSAAHALASDMGWDHIELNASDSRTKDDIERLAGRASKNATLGGSGHQLIIVDEADNFHGNVDRGGSKAVTSIVKESDQPMVLIANDYYEMSNGVRNACQEIEFRDVGKRSIVPVLRDLCRQEDIAFEDAALEAIAETNSGDLRGAVNDLQALAEGRDELREEDVATGERDRTHGVFDYLDTVIKEAGAQEALETAYDVDETPDDLINWIEDNMPKDYEGGELARAYDFLANADRWLGRVRATQDYTYWRYATDNMTAGVAAAREGKKGGWTRYGPPSYWSKLGRSRGTRNTRDYVARKIAAEGGVSMSTARREVMPYLATMTHHCKNRELTVAMAARYDLDADHVSLITGSGEDTNKVQSIVEDAERLREEAAVEASGGAFEGGRASSETDESDGGDAVADADGDGDDAGDSGGDGDDANDSDGDGQATLAASAGTESDDANGSDDGAAQEEADGDADDEADAAAEDQQSGLGDFM
ncbi:replication factor C large subunit [Halorientalis marina]|uniref:replication factor C large subunit n=1 Tax=Halorientalis marina TaxID=2931976 RepID=UPI001FF6BFB6|nr:replication factor C large subunit [Halorientalis marina]